MADDSEREWLVEPPAAGEISLYLAVGEGVRLTAEQEAAISALLRTLEGEDSEVTGFAPKCPKQATCNKLTCKPVDCGPLVCGTLKAELTGGGFNLIGNFDSGIG